MGAALTLQRPSFNACMCKQVTAIVLLAALSLQILNRTVIYIDYYTNMAAYAKSCENKARPVMHCNGKCQMMKKLQQDEKKDSQLPERKSTNDEIISSKSFFTSVDHFPAGITVAYNIFPHTCTSKMPRSCFHPPGA
jgi:hypothetical protein